MPNYLDDFVCERTIEELYDYDYWVHEVWEEELSEEDRYVDY